MFESSWVRCWESIGAKGTGQALMQRLVEAYQEPHRRYHTEQHLKECLTIFGEHPECAQEPGEVEMALWFHDAIYNVNSFDNEARSAEWAVGELSQAEVHPDRISRIQAHVLATRHSALPVGQDQQFLVDIDLSILGVEPTRFEEYERQIRQEYSYVPGFIFERKRRKVLAGFLARNPIYNTPALHQKFEKQARFNISQSCGLILN